MRTVSYQDIYGGNEMDTLPENAQTQNKTNPNDSNVTGSVSKDKASIVNIKGNLLGQPLIWWFGFIAILVVLKLTVEKEG